MAKRKQRSVVLSFPTLGKVDLGENNRGWKIKTSISGVDIIEGDDGEVLVTVHSSGMQSGVTDYLIVVQKCDSFITAITLRDWPAVEAYLKHQLADLGEF